MEITKFKCINLGREFVRGGDDWWGEEAEHQPGPLFF
jgi:hypothetical protein